MEKLVELLQQQIAQQREESAQQREESARLREESAQLREESKAREERLLQEQQKLLQEAKARELRHQEQFKEVLARIRPETPAGQIGRAAPTQANIPNFNAFESTSELWSDYYSRFQTFVRAHSVPARIQAQVFLTNQVSTTYKLLSNLAAQEEPPVDINALTLQQIVAYMGRQFDPKRFVVRERFRFWNDMSRKPGETVRG